MGHAHLGTGFVNPEEAVQSTLSALGIVPLAQQLYEANAPATPGIPAYTRRADPNADLSVETPFAMFVAGSKTDPLQGVV